MKRPTIQSVEEEAVNLDHEAVLHAHTLQMTLSNGQHRGLPSLSWLRDQVAVGVVSPSWGQCVIKQQMCCSSFMAVAEAACLICLASEVSHVIDCIQFAQRERLHLKSGGHNKRAWD